ncbi:MAG: hypothetical protein HEEMFOPI_01565 [Holosporales bacterium]
MKDALLHLIQTDPRYKDILLFIGVIDFNDIPKNFLDLFFEENIVEQFISDMKKLGFLTKETFHKNTHYFSVHPFVQEQLLIFLKNWTVEKDLNIFLNQKIDVLFHLIKQKKGSFNFYESIAHHMENFYNHNIVDSQSKIKLLKILGDCHYFGTRRLYDALKYYVQIQREDDSFQFLSNKDRIDIYFFLGILYTDMGKCYQALDMIEKGLLLCGESDLYEKASFLSQKGYALSHFHKKEEAEKVFKQALCLLSMLGTDEKYNYLRSTIKGQMASLFSSTNLTKDNKMGLFLIQEAFDFLSFNGEIKAGIPRFVCYHYATLGHIYCRYGMYEEALKEGFTKTMYIIENKLDGCPHYIIKIFTQSGIGECYFWQGSYEKAKDLLRYVVDRTYELRGREFSPVYKPQTYLMASYYKLGLYKECEQELQELMFFDVSGSTCDLLWTECVMLYYAGSLYLKTGDFEKCHFYFSLFYKKMQNFRHIFDSKNIDDEEFAPQNLKDFLDLKKKAKHLLKEVYPKNNF